MGSIIIPLFLSTVQLLSKGPKILFGQTKMSYWFTMLSTILIYPMFLTMKEGMLVEASKTYEVDLDRLKDTKYHVSEFIQADLGLESHLQVTISIILLLLANSETRTITGLEVLFENESFFYLPTKVALGLSILWSLYSCINSHLKGISKKREYSNFMSTLTILVYTVSSIFIRVFSYVLYLTPCLGLLDCLRHLQGEMYPFYQPYHGWVDASKDTFHYGNAPPIPWSTISRWKYTSKTKAQPPNLTLYTWFTIEEYYFGLLGMFVLNISLQILVKMLTNPDVFGKLSWIEKLIHGISSCFIPFAMQDWDEVNGTVAKHKQRQELVFKELFTSLMINFLINIILLSPLIILGKI